MRTAAAVLSALVLAGAAASTTLAKPRVSRSSSIRGENSSRSESGQQLTLGDKIITEAERYFGVNYAWNGRDTTENPGMDCLGIIFRAYAKTFNFDWTNIPVVDNKLMVDSGYLGKPVAGLDGVLWGELDITKLMKGDVLLFLSKSYASSHDTPLLIKDNEKYFTWHTGLYKGTPERLVIHAAPGFKVMEQPLEDIFFDALYVTRRIR